MAHRPRKRFGQHFLVDPGVVDAILAAIAPRPDDVIVEIGPGPGVLTRPLAARCANLHAIELDRDLARELRGQFARNDNVHIHEGDALAFDFTALGDNLRVVGNLPYNISTPLLFHLLDARRSIADMHFMLQKEVVDRMAAAPGGRTWGRLSVMLGSYLGIEALFDVDREAFDPPPAVMSAVVRLVPLPDGTHAINDEALLARIVADAFSQRRKTLRNALKRVMTPDDWHAVRIDPVRRPETLSVEEWVLLANHLATNTDIPGRTG